MEKDRTKRQGRILVVDDQRNQRATIAMMLRGGGYEVEEAADGAQGIESGASGAFDLVITDLLMGEIDGLDVLRAVKNAQPMTEVLVMTQYGTIESAVDAMRIGAFDYLQKPFSEQELIVKVCRAVESRRLHGQVLLFAREFGERYQGENIVGRSGAIRDGLARLTKFAATDAPVLITGESGTGKELIARAMHANSARARHPFVVVNCAAISEVQLESELFGHARGAFSGATSARKALFEEADGGTIFFDEIAETTPSFQAKLLRAIQDGEIRRVGENKAISVDVRVIAASNADLLRATEERRLRPDLYYRLRVAHIEMSPLRERPEDIPLLAEHFLNDLRVKLGLNARLGAGVLERLSAYEFPGNVRELRTILEHGALVAESGEIGLSEIRRFTEPRSADRTRDRADGGEDELSEPRDPSRVFISYSHQDIEWLKRLQVHLAPLERQGKISRWDDTKLVAGSQWQATLEAALRRAGVAILLVSSDFLASQFIAENELPVLLQAAKARGLRVLCLILRPCLFQEHAELASFQALNAPARPLSSLTQHEQEELLVSTARVVIQGVTAISS